MEYKTKFLDKNSNLVKESTLGVIDNIIIDEFYINLGTPMTINIIPVMVTYELINTQDNNLTYKEIKYNVVVR